jgi:hypothetical protein
MLRLSLISMLAALGALALAPAVSPAADTYVNGDGGSDANDCTVITTPCQTIGEALADAGPNDTVHVDDNFGNYVGSLVLSDGKDLLATNIDGLGGAGPHTIIGTIAPTISIATISPGSTVTGFLLQNPPSGGMTVEVQSAATFRGNTINNSDVDQTTLRISIGGGNGTVIDDNDFNGDNTTVTDAIAVVDGDPQITNNNIGSGGNGYNIGVNVSSPAANPTIAGNTFGAIKEDTAETNPGTAIRVTNGQATIRRNVIGQLGPGDVIGVQFMQTAPMLGTGGAVSGNVIHGNGTLFGINVLNTALPVNLDSNLVRGFLTGLDSAGGTGTGNSEGDVTASNMTFVENGTDIALFDTHLTLDSSIVEDALSVSGGGGGNPGCTITFSRGPSTLPGTCTQFQTTADPGFVDSGSGNYHLLASSPMVDAGNTAAPPAGSVDYDGDARAIDADGACPVALRRDIGADELFKPTPDCTPKATPPPAKAKCKKKKKKKKGKSGAAAAKKKKKKGCKKKKRKKR